MYVTERSTKPSGQHQPKGEGGRTEQRPEYRELKIEFCLPACKKQTSGGSSSSSIIRATRGERAPHVCPPACSHHLLSALVRFTRYRTEQRPRSHTTLSPKARVATAYLSIQFPGLFPSLKCDGRQRFIIRSPFQNIPCLLETAFPFVDIDKTDMVGFRSDDDGDGDGASDGG
jgi:hypothetical protein